MLAVTTADCPGAILNGVKTSRTGPNRRPTDGERLCGRCLPDSMDREPYAAVSANHRASVAS
jgi:hypothetical protein